MCRHRRLSPGTSGRPLAQATLLCEAWQTAEVPASCPLVGHTPGLRPGQGGEAQDPATARPHGHAHLPRDPELCRGPQREAEVKHPQAGFLGRGEWGEVPSVSGTLPVADVRAPAERCVTNTPWLLRAVTPSLSHFCWDRTRQ